MMQAPVMAATYVVAPFKVSGPQGYSYLGQAIPSMLTSRLYLQGQYEPSERQDAALKEKAPASRDAAAAMAKKFGADYVVWGSVTIMGDQASLDVSALSPNGKVWKDAVTSPVSALIGGLQGVADSVNAEVFGRKDVRRPAASGPASPSSAFIMNETTMDRVQGDTYLNPSLRYQGTESAAAQIRSQMLNYECLSMEVADIDGDKKNEVLMLTPDHLFAYRWKADAKLEMIAEYDVPASMEPVMVRSIRQGKDYYITLAGYDDNDYTPYSQVLQLTGGKFKVVVKSARRFLNVASVPPLYVPTIIGQDGSRSKGVTGPVYEMYMQNGQLRRGGNLSNLPKEATVFNFSWIPADKGKRGDHLALIAENETLLTFDARGKRLAGTQDVYGGSSVFLVGDRSLSELSQSSGDDSDNVLHYVPMRMPVTDLDGDGRHELLANKPITMAGKLFNNYRTYPQGEIHAMLWDGMGMELLWKTRRIKGTVCDLTVADVDNDGRIDLVVGVNAYGGLGSGLKTRCAVYVYPLDTNQVNARPNYQE